jgi:hypothetical protein
LTPLRALFIGKATEFLVGKGAFSETEELNKGKSRAGLVVKVLRDF